MGEIEKTTAPYTSVGADEGLSFTNPTEYIIPQYGKEINDQSEDLEIMRRRMLLMDNPNYLHTISMTELYQTTYKSRPPIIDGLLYAGAYILAGAPKIGKSFLVAQLAYHVSTGEPIWGYEVHQGTVLYLALEDDFQRIQGRMFQMYGINDTPPLRNQCTEAGQRVGRPARILYSGTSGYQAYNHRHDAKDSRGRRRKIQLRQRL